MTPQERQRGYQSAMSYIAKTFGIRKPLLFGAHGEPLASVQYSRTAAKQQGSLKNWTPSLLPTSTAAWERAKIVERSIDLINSDGHAAGVVDSFATVIVGSGLTPHPTIDPDAIGLSKEEVRAIQFQQKQVYNEWLPWADAGQRMSFGQLQWVVKRSMLACGEAIVLLPMLRDPMRPYSLACQIVHPLRLSTPSDLQTRSNIKDGVEVGEYGEPVAYWIRRADIAAGSFAYPSNSAEYERIPAKDGHRWKVRHIFNAKDPEQVRGYPVLTPTLKQFRDLSDFLDAELVSNVVTAAYALFIETQGNSDPLYSAQAMASFTDIDASGIEERIEEVPPGSVTYLNQGQKVTMASPTRPGATFEPFIRVIKDAISSSFGMSRSVVFKDIDGLSYAGGRLAWLDAWRIFTSDRAWLGQGLCQPIYTMLMEEAYLRNRLQVRDFYGMQGVLCAVDWRGPAKGNIEPVQEAKADVILIENNIKSLAEAIADRGGDWRATLEQREEEIEELNNRGLVVAAPNEPTDVVSPAAPAKKNVSNEDMPDDSAE